MSLVLTLVEAPRPQIVRRMSLREDEEIVIGRGAGADWRIEDPDNYVSRAHCTVSGRGGGYMVTDTSSGGLFVDDASRPLGPGRPLALRDGMRLRLGDYVMRVELDAAPAAPPPPGGAARDFDADAFFAAPAAPPPREARPRGLPDPFDPPPSFVPPVDTTPPERRGPPAFDDPFTLDPLPSERVRERPPPRGGGEGGGLGGGGFDWGEPAPAAPEPADAPAQPEDFGAEGFDWGPAAPPAPKPAREPTPEPRPSAAAGPGEDALFAAFLRGLGLDAADAPQGDRLARMEAFGREYRMMAEGLMRLLRLRAEEKGNARLAQTVVGSAEVNPLKFMPTVEDALAVMAQGRAGGFAEAEVAIAGAVRDLAAHHAGTWRGTQAALRRMVDRFDPAAIEKELDELGLLEQLLAGGRRAKLWELYQKRFRAIAESAETRFLGEVGADFRDAYEGEK
ncbi:type VI secretion system-associated FHA domain protein TagH [Amaricoccus solimangrovi]|uniref:Type VI secretion system-associated FHA domain protein TagH n=1 Tax=Amaricoccus solimangrovi TaxID=2589815 RepID=A0A501WL35_9RHOB|nr:type VI secretion system-associated FHA domain protein TagH [Amaricoccus solimangrovi]TPE49100.1 type VI secretion system-associated FHA domain protein TagH [Amaricoccus solimangrovi]